MEINIAYKYIEIHHSLQALPRRVWKGVFLFCIVLRILFLRRLWKWRSDQMCIRDRLDMGLTPKTRVMVRKVAPMGDPIELHLRGYELTLRLEDAREIEIEEDTSK